MRYRIDGVLRQVMVLPRAAGTPVVAIMGGMGRTRNGTYAELVAAPATNVVAVDTALSWTDLVAVPEAYASAWAGLHQNLDLCPGQTVVVRGATSTLGQAAVNIAVRWAPRAIRTPNTSDGITGQDSRNIMPAATNAAEAPTPSVESVSTSNMSRQSERQ